ncbi:GNAT superfamily N-acetyltransferase [Inhella inkyongensis]|uniref:GNAT superfamily N-acetyltransferase n=1 Tax=Inhella inkyongensis TaxID=392593 RepID=A0A840S9L3_9BURK|nr:GNAT family N-acetyltransferase [Inhella inkyongensis]MBB5205090.1 GNAT superfamily N-acetyltransferase [Inhella inkyongensis]
MSPEIRPARAEDTTQLAALTTLVWLDTYEAGGLSQAGAAEALSLGSPVAMAARLLDPKRQVLVLCDRKLLLGYAEIEHPAPCPEQPSATTELARLYVIRHMQGRGLGGRLLTAAENQAKALGAHSLWLTAWVGNAQALRFYAHKGYRDAGLRSFAFQDQVVENRLLIKDLN